MFHFVPWTSTMMSDPWKANSFQDCSLITDQLKIVQTNILITDQNFFMLSTKQLFVSSKDKTYAHTKATGTWPTLDKGTTCWHLPFCWLPYRPAPSLTSSVHGKGITNFQNPFGYSIFWQQMLRQVHQFSATLLGLGFLVWNYSVLFSPYSTIWQWFFSLPFSITEFSRLASFWFYTEFQKAIIWI